MKALVTGANGFIGEHLVKRLSHAGWEVAGVQRQGQITHLNQVFANLNIPCDKLEDVDVIFHTAGLAHSHAKGSSKKVMEQVNAHDSVTLFDAASAAGVKKFVWLSSIKVLGDVSQTPFKPTDAHAPCDRYARSKALGEVLLQEASAKQNSTHLAIVRPPLVYGPGVGANFLKLGQWALSGWPLPLLQATAPRAWIGVRNLVNFLLHLGAPQLANVSGIWHVRDEEEASVVQMIGKICDLAGQPKRLFSVHPTVFKTMVTVMARPSLAQRFFAPLQIDIAESQSELDWHPTYRQREELEEFLAWLPTQS